LRRLFSPFARGWPGVGLFLMRLAVGGSLILDGIERCRVGSTVTPLLLGLLAIADGVLLAVGLWTPIAGPLVVLISAWAILLGHDNQHANVLSAAIGAALALVGPGALSIDARLFGWKRIDLEN